MDLETGARRRILEDIDNDDRSTSPDIEDLVSGTRNGDTMTVQIDDGRTELTFTRR